MRYRENLDAFDMTGGKYSAHKIPKGGSVPVDITDYLMLEGETSWDEPRGLLSS